MWVKKGDEYLYCLISGLLGAKMAIKKMGSFRVKKDKKLPAEQQDLEKSVSNTNEEVKDENGKHENIENGNHENIENVELENSCDNSDLDRSSTPDDEDEIDCDKVNENYILQLKMSEKSKEMKEEMKSQFGEVELW